MPGTRKIVQLYRNRELIEPSNNNSALENAKLSVENLTPVDGEIVLIRYKEDDSDIVKSLVAVYHAEIDNEDSGWTFLTIDDYYNKEEIDETERVIAAALAQLDGDITTLSEVVENNTQGLSDLSDRINAITESDPVFTESPAATITSSDITNWNGKTSNVGTITGIIMNGVSKGTSGDVDLGTVVTTETDPTVPSWAKASTKPLYTASEVGAVPTTRTVNGLPLSSNIALTAGDVGALPNDTVIPTKVSELTNDSGFTTNTGTITGITMNGVSKGTSGVVDLGTVLTSHQDISGKADKSDAIGSLSLALDSTNYKITLSGTKVDGTTFTVSNVIDLPLESVVVNGSYDNTTKKVVLTLQSGSTVEFSVADLVAGLQSEITSTNKLSADLISDGTTNKVVTSTEKNTWNNAASNSHTHSNKTVLDGITSTDITNWNNKTDNVGTVTGVKMNNETNSPTNGVVDLGTVITQETQLSVTVGGKGNAVTGMTVNNHSITLQKGTFLTEHQDISGKADVVTLVTRNDNGTASLALESGKFYVFSNALTSLTIQSLTQPSSGLGIYAGKFTAGTGGCTFGYPATVNAAPSVPTAFEDGKTYEFSIMDNELYCQEA
jgi:hypothetical protein